MCIQKHPITWIVDIASYMYTFTFNAIKISCNDMIVCSDYRHLCTILQYINCFFLVFFIMNMEKKTVSNKDKRNEMLTAICGNKITTTSIKENNFASEDLDVWLWNHRYWITNSICLLFFLIMTILLTPIIIFFLMLWSNVYCMTKTSIINRNTIDSMLIFFPPFYRALGWTSSRFTKTWPYQTCWITSR